MEINDSETAVFSERLTCISCGSRSIKDLANGRFDEGALKSFIDSDPWGENPVPFLRGKPWSYVVCGECGLSFHRYILDPQWNERRFSKWMSQDAIQAFESSVKNPAYEFGKAADYVAHILRIEHLTRVQRGVEALRILDFGCGYGNFLSMCSLFGIEAYGVDRSSAKRENSRSFNVFPEIEDLEGMPLFHALTLFEVMEHLDDPRGLLIRLRDLLVSGGILVVETPDCSGVSGIETQSDYRKIHPLDHINGFTPETLSGFVSRLGFTPIAKPTSFVTCEAQKVAKVVVKRLLRPILQKTTQLYFRKA